LRDGDGWRGMECIGEPWRVVQNGVERLVWMERLYRGKGVECGTEGWQVVGSAAVERVKDAKERL